MRWNKTIITLKREQKFQILNEGICKINYPIKYLDQTENGLPGEKKSSLNVTNGSKIF